MASITLAQAAPLAQDDLIAGVIENIVTVNRMFEVLPFISFAGNALSFNRESALGAAGVADVGDSITTDVTDAITAVAGGKAAATFTNVTATLTTLIADAELNNLVQSQLSSDGNDQKALQVASKAKNIGRQFQHMLINGTGSNGQFSGLINLCAVGQTVDTGVNGAPISLAFLDELLDLVVDKNGQVDYITMHARTLRAYNALLRQLGGASIDEVVTLPSGAQVPAYRGVPIFRNDYIPINQTTGGTSNTTTVFAGTFDEGGMQNGIAGLTSTEQAGVKVIEVGEKEDADESITRVRWYCGLANFSELGLACLPGITN
jgi:hypothetical protein